MKKYISLFLCVLMIFSCSIQAFADAGVPDYAVGITDATAPEASVSEAEEADEEIEAGYDANVTSTVDVVENSDVSASATTTGTWVQSSNGKWWYRYSDGTYPANGWAYINGYWYYFDASGWMQTGWLTLNGKKYYLGTSGAMAIGWRQIGSYWYYFWSGGSMATGWQYLAYSGGNAWFYFDSNGRMATSDFSVTVYNSAGQANATKTYKIQNNGVWLYTTSVLYWTLIDSSNHLDYTGSSLFANYFHTAASKWNSYKPGVVRSALQASAVDVVIVDDYYITARAVTSADGIISINPNLVSQEADDYNTTLKTCMHEMGHALGLGDNDSQNVMYGAQSATTTLTTSDKRSYDLSYNR